MQDKKLKQALRKIKDECQKHKVCYSCKFHEPEPYGCALKGRPDKWIIGGINTDKWYTLYSWLVDIRAATTGMVTSDPGEYTARMVRRDLLDEILEYMNQLNEEEDDG